MQVFYGSYNKLGPDMGKKKERGKGKWLCAKKDKQGAEAQRLFAAQKTVQNLRQQKARSISNLLLGV